MPPVAKLSISPVYYSPSDAIGLRRTRLLGTTGYQIHARWATYSCNGTPAGLTVADGLAAYAGTGNPQLHFPQELPVCNR